MYHRPIGPSPEDDPLTPEEVWAEVQAINRRRPPQDEILRQADEDDRERAERRRDRP